MENLRLVYKKELATAKAHVQAQNKPNNGNALTKEKRNKMLEFNIDCVHCGTLLSGNNYNTEHILDVSLGGQNSVDNKMLMCKICNSARAELKTSLLGNQPTMDKWGLVEAYVLWSFITVDHGHVAGVNVPSVHQEFLRLASGGRERERNGTRWFARASNTSLTAPVPGRASTTPPRTTVPRVRSAPRRGLLSFGWRDWFRGSERDRTRARRASNTLEQQKSIAPSGDDEPISEPVSNPTPLPREELLAMVIGQIPRGGEIKQATLCNRVMRSDIHNRSLRVLLTEQGYPKSKAIGKILEELLDGHATFTGESNARGWTLAEAAQTHPAPNEPDNMQQDASLPEAGVSFELDSVGEALVRRVRFRNKILPLSKNLKGQTTLQKLSLKYSIGQDASLKSVAHACGYPKSWSLQKCFNDAAGDVFELSPVVSDFQVSKVEPKALLVQKFNNAQARPRFPPTPLEFAALIKSYEAIPQDPVAWDDLHRRLVEFLEYPSNAICNGFRGVLAHTFERDAAGKPILPSSSAEGLFHRIQQKYTSTVNERQYDEATKASITEFFSVTRGLLAFDAEEE